MLHSKLEKLFKSSQYYEFPLKPVAVMTSVEGLNQASPSDSRPNVPPSWLHPGVNTKALFSLVFSLSVIVTVLELVVAL